MKILIVNFLALFLINCTVKDDTYNKKTKLKQQTFNVIGKGMYSYELDTQEYRMIKYLYTQSFKKSFDQKSLLKGTSYTVYFDKLLLRMNLKDKNSMVILAKEAYALENMQELLFNEARIFVDDSPYTLKSDSLVWKAHQSFVVNPVIKNKNYFIKSNGDSLEGSNLHLNYQEKTFSLENVTMTFEEK